MNGQRNPSHLLFPPFSFRDFRRNPFANSFTEKRRIRKIFETMKMLPASLFQLFKYNFIRTFKTQSSKDLFIKLNTLLIKVWQRLSPSIVFPFKIHYINSIFLLDIVIQNIIEICMQCSFLDQISTTAIEQIRTELYFISLKIASKKSWLYSFPSALRKKKKNRLRVKGSTWPTSIFARSFGNALSRNIILRVQDRRDKRLD